MKATRTSGQYGGPTKYRGAPRASKPVDKTPGGLAAADDEPGVVCPDCDTRVKLRPDGLMVRHAPYGRKSSMKHLRFACAASMHEPKPSTGPKQYPLSECRVLVTPEGVAHLVARREVKGVEGTPWVPLCKRAPIEGRISNGREKNWRKREVVRCSKCKTHVRNQ